MALILNWTGDFYDEWKDRASVRAFEECKRSWGNTHRILIQQAWEHFRSPRVYIPQNVPEWSQWSAGMDGNGTRVITMDAANRHENMGFSTMAMLADDFARFGWIPLVGLTTVWAESVKTDAQYEAYDRLMTGLWQAAKRAQVVLFWGETAQLPGIITSPNPNATLKSDIVGAMIWMYNTKTLILWEKVKAWNIIVALREPWIRDNGHSMHRRAKALAYWKNWHQTIPPEELEGMVTKSVIYTSLITAANGWDNKDGNYEPLVGMTGVGHITGEWLIWKFMKPFLMQQQLSANLHSLFPIWENIKTTVRQLIENNVPFDDEEFYKTFPNGNGMLVICDNLVEAEKLVAMAPDFEVEAQICGEIIENGKWHWPQIIMPDDRTIAHILSGK